MNIQYLAEYLEFLDVEKGLSVNTVEAYKNDLSYFFEYCVTRGASEINKIERSDINSYIMKLRELKYSPSSVVRKIASLRGFFKWFCANEYGDKNPTLTLERPKLPQRLPKVMTVEELKLKLMHISPKLRMVNNNGVKILRTIGFCAGSGSEFIKETPCDAFVTGDIKFHTAIESDKVLFDIGHFESEIFAVKFLRELTGINETDGIIADEESPFS